MDGAASAVTLELGQVQGFKHHTLTRECCVTVNLHWQHGELVVVAVEAILLGSHNALKNGVNRL